MLHVEFKKHPFRTCLWGVGFHEKPEFFYNLSGDLNFDVLITGLSYICLIVGQALDEPLFHGQTKGRGKLGMVPCHSCYVVGTIFYSVG